MMKKLYSLFLILTPIKKVHAFQTFMPVSVTFVAINDDQIMKKGFCLEIFSWGKGSVSKNKPPRQWLIICCRVYFLSLSSFIHKVLKQKNTLEKFITDAEVYLELRQIPTMEFFGLTFFAKKLHRRFLIGFKMHLCSGRRYLKVK